MLLPPASPVGKCMVSENISSTCAVSHSLIVPHSPVLYSVIEISLGYFATDVFLNRSLITCIVSLTGLLICLVVHSSTFILILV